MTTSLPIIFCGRKPDVVMAAMALLAPEVDAIHVCHTPEAVITEVTALLRGEEVTPVSGLGSNIKRSPDQRPKPVAMSIGGAFTPEDIEKFKEFEILRSIPWIIADTAKTGHTAVNLDYAKVAVNRQKQCIEEHGLMDGQIRPENVGKIWYW